MTVLLTFFGLVGLLFGVYFVITSLGGFLSGRHYRLPDAEPSARIAAIIPARNESAVVPNLVKSLLEQRYPRSLFDVYVVPNNCDDDTEAVALRAGARILPCTGPVTRKGDVLRQAFSQLSATGQYDAYCVFDADNVVHPDFFSHVNRAVHAGYDVAQGFRDSKNPFDSWISGGTSVFYWFMSRVFNESRARLGLNCHLNGTGFMVTDALVRRLDWDTRTLTEDLEFTGLCALNDAKIGWMPEARVYDEQPIRLRDSAIQRRRWTAGALQCMRRYSLRLLRKGTPCSLDIGLLFLGNLMNYVGLLSVILSAVRFWPLLADHLPGMLAFGVAYVATLWTACAVAALLVVRGEGRLCREALPTILLFPLFLFSWMPINLYACLTPPPQWRMIGHTRSLSLNEISDRGQS